MDKKTYGKILLSCLCFLGIIYGLASIDQSHRKNKDDLATMAEEPDTPVKEKLAEPKVMYLTFDDGPSKYTEEVLDILDQYHIKATFFVTGEDEHYADMLTDIHDRGHAIGIHTYSHDYATIYNSVDAYFQDIEKVDNLINEKTGITTHILRFPGGSSNTVSKKYCDGIMTLLAQETMERGYSYYDWNADNGDGDPSLSADTLYEKAMTSIKGKQTVMMLMHDGSGNGNTVKALDRTLAELVRQGWEFRIIEETDTMPLFHHTIAN